MGFLHRIPVWRERNVVFLSCFFFLFPFFSLFSSLKMEIALFTAISCLVLNLSFQPGMALRISETKKEHKTVEVLLKDNRFDSRQADSPCTWVGTCTSNRHCCGRHPCLNGHCSHHTFPAGHPGGQGKN